MRMKKLILLIAVAMLALAHRSDGQQARPVAEQLRLALLTRIDRSNAISSIYAARVLGN